jgi:hypothetical protein
MRRGAFASVSEIKAPRAPGPLVGLPTAARDRRSRQQGRQQSSDAAQAPVTTVRALGLEEQERGVTAASGLPRGQCVGLDAVNARQLEPAQASAPRRSFPRRSPRGRPGEREVRATFRETQPDSAVYADCDLGSGGGGIRTLGAGVTHTTVFETARFNHSRTPPGATVQGSDSAQRRERKNAWSSSAHSCASSPPATSGRWFRRGSASTSSTDPAAPALGSVVP